MDTAVLAALAVMKVPGLLILVVLAVVDVVKVPRSLPVNVFGAAAEFPELV